MCFYDEKVLRRSCFSRPQICNANDAWLAVGERLRGGLENFCQITSGGPNPFRTAWNQGKPGNHCLLLFTRESLFIEDLMPMQCDYDGVVVVWYCCSCHEYRYDRMTLELLPCRGSIGMNVSYVVRCCTYSCIILNMWLDEEIRYLSFDVVYADYVAPLWLNVFEGLAWAKAMYRV